MSRASIELKLRDKLDKHVARRAQELRNVIVETLSQPGTGRAYGKHVASAPGEPPAVDTGTLRQSIRIEKHEPMVYAVGTNIAYAVPLEYGTHRIAPRPFMRPSVEQFRQTL